MSNTLEIDFFEDYPQLISSEKKTHKTACISYAQQRNAKIPLMFTIQEAPLHYLNNFKAFA